MQLEAQYLTILDFAKKIEFLCWDLNYNIETTAEASSKGKHLEVILI